MFFHFLQARPQGLFISAYLGGMYIRDKHQYKRDSLKPDVRKKIRDKKIQDRLDKFNNESKAIIQETETFFKRTFDKEQADQGDIDRGFAKLESFNPKTLYDSTSFENIYPQSTYDRQKRIFIINVNLLKKDLIGELDEDLDSAYEKILGELDQRTEVKYSEFVTSSDKEKVVQNFGYLRRFLHTRDTDAQRLAPEAVGYVTAAEKSRQEAFRKETGEFIADAKQGATKLFGIFTDPLTEAKDKPAGPSDPYIPGFGANAEPVFNPSKDSNKSNWNIAIEGEVKPEKSVVPILGIGVGYLKSLPGHAFAGGEVYCIRPMTTISYILKIDKPDEEPRGKLAVKVPWSIGASVIAGKCINPYVGLYVKTGIEFTNVNFTYTVDNDDIPFGKDNKSSNEEKFNLTLKPIFAGFGAMIFGEHWIVAAEYNALTFTKQTIRDYDTIGGDERKRGYAYSGLHHRLLLRLFLIANG